MLMSRRASLIAQSLALLLFFLVCATPIAARAASFRIENNGDHTIVGIWVSPSWASNWGQELLGDDVLDPGYYAKEYVSGCYADIRVVYDDEQVLTKYNFDTCVYNLESNY